MTCLVTRGRILLGSLFVDVSNLRLLMPVLSVLLLRNLDISGSGLCVMGLLGVMGLLSVMGLLLHVVGLIDVSRSVSSLLLHVVRLLNVVGLRVDRLAVVLCLVRRSIWLIWHVVVAVFCSGFIGRCIGRDNGGNTVRDSSHLFNN